MVEIVMAVYNGENFVAQQIDSIFKQTFQDWRLVIRDDCSTDQTLEILDTYKSLHPDQIIYSSNLVNSSSPKDNFYDMIQDSEAPYLMTCDHDDVWLPDKIAKTMHCMQRMEKRFGSQTPILVHTDLAVVDEQLQTRSPSMFKSQKLDARRVSLRELLVQNQVTGCTMMINRALIERAGRIPTDAVMHDWWYALAAAAFGKIGFVATPTILYRQHSGNQVGAKDVTNWTYWLERIKSAEDIKKMFGRTYRQAEAFLNQFQEELSPAQRELISAYVSLARQNKVQRMQTLVRYRFFKGGSMRKLGQIYYQ